MELIITSIAYSAFTLLISIFLTIPFSNWLAKQIGAVDLPGEIKIHSQPTPRLGGLGILLAFVLSLSGLLGITGTTLNSVHSQLLVLLALLFGIAIIGFLDDLRGLNPLLRLVLEGVIGIVLVLAIIEPKTSWILVVAWFWIVGLMNAYNFIDGLDGLAASIAAVNLFALGAMFFISGDGCCAIVAFTLALATCGFLRYNLPPASIFMGDIGSLSLGFVISTLSLKLLVQENFALNVILAVALAASLPLGDLIATVFRRLINRKPLFQGDRGHFYDVLMDRFKLSSANSMRFSLLVALGVSSLAVVVYSL